MALFSTRPSLLPFFEAYFSNFIEGTEFEVQEAVAEAIAFAKSSPLPKPEEALLDVFAP